MEEPPGGYAFITRCQRVLERPGETPGRVVCGHPACSKHGSFFRVSFKVGKKMRRDCGTMFWDTDDVPETVETRPEGSTAEPNPSGEYNFEDFCHHC